MGNSESSCVKGIHWCTMSFCFVPVHPRGLAKSMIVNQFHWFYWHRTRFCGPQRLELFSFVCVFVFVSVIPRVLHSCVLFFERMLWQALLWVHFLFTLVFRRLYEKNPPWTSLQNNCVFGFSSFGSRSRAVRNDRRLRKPLAVCSF